MTKLNPRLKKHDIGLVDSQTGKVLKTQKAIDVSDELPLLPPGSSALRLYYTTAQRGQIVQLRLGSTSVHYFTEAIHREKDLPSALTYWATWTGSSKAKLIELCLKYAPAPAA